MNSSKYRWSLSVKTLTLSIPEDYILYLTNLTDRPELLIAKTSNVNAPNWQNIRELLRYVMYRFTGKQVSAINQTILSYET